MILPHLNYRILLWGNYSKSVFTMQKKIVRTVTNSRLISHSDPLFKQNRILKVQDIYHNRMVKFYHSFINKCLPSFFNSLNFSVNGHKYYTRNNKLYLPKVKHEFSKNLILYRVSDHINNCDKDIFDKLNYTSVVYLFKKILLV